MQHSRPNAVTC